MSSLEVQLRRVDPQGVDAMALLREAAIDARALYPELHSPGAPWPSNPPTPPRGTYLIVYLDGVPAACGALRPLDDRTTEVRRMYVLKTARRSGLARTLLRALEQEAAALGFTRLRLETGQRQAAAIALYESHGFVRIPPFGPHVGDPFSVCFEKPVQAPGTPLRIE